MNGDVAGLEHRHNVRGCGHVLATGDATVEKISRLFRGRPAYNGLNINENDQKKIFLKIKLKDTQAVTVGLRSLQKGVTVQTAC